MPYLRYPTWFGHPKGMFLLAFTEFWERFSYYGMTGLLVIFLSDKVSNGGWGWNAADAVMFYSFYAGLVFVVPIVGAWIANSYLGERRCIVAGAWLLLFGHFMLGGSAFFPPVIEHFMLPGADAVIAQSEVAFGRVWDFHRINAELLMSAVTSSRSEVESQRLYSAALWTYYTKSGSFILGLVAIVVATGLFKSPISSIVSKLYPVADARRDAGYAVFFTCIYLGVVLANFVAGGLGERFGWHYGFGAAAAGIAIALGAYHWKEREYLGTLGLTADLAHSRAGANAAPALTQEESHRVAVVVLQGIFTIIYAAAFFQKGGALSIYTREHVDRAVLGVEVPATWFLSISTVIFMVAAPLLAAVSSRLDRRGRNPSASYKLALGLFVIAIAYAILASAEAARVQAGLARVGSAWMIGPYLLFGVAEALVWPNQIALATKLAPKRYTALTVGAWYLTAGFGTWLAGLLFGVLDDGGDLRVFKSLAGMCLASSVLVLLLTPFMRRWMHGAEQPAR